MVFPLVQDSLTSLKRIFLRFLPSYLSVHGIFQLNFLIKVRNFTRCCRNTFFLPPCAVKIIIIIYHEFTFNFLFIRSTHRVYFFHQIYVVMAFSPLSHILENSISFNFHNCFDFSLILIFFFSINMREFLTHFLG